MTRKTLVLAVLVLACSTRAPGRSVTAPRPTASGISIRVALATPRAGQVVSATSDFNWLRGVGTRAQPLASARARQEWRVEREQGGERVRVIRPDGVQTAWHQTLTARPRAGGLMTVNGRRYRGEIILGVSDRGAL